MSGLWLLLSCTGVGSGDSGFEPPEWEDLDEVPEPAVLAEDLDDPRGLALADDGLLVLEAGAGTLLVLSADGEVDEVAGGLEGVRWVEAHGEEALVVGTGTAWRVDLATGGAKELATLSSGGPADLGDDGAVALVDGAGLWLGDLEEISFVLELTGATDVAWSGDQVLVARRDAKEVVVADGTTGEALDAISLEDGPVSLAVADGDVFLTARSTRWPNAGWVMAGPVEALEEISTTPPDPGRVAVGEDDVFWASKQSITAVPREGGTYEVVGARTAVAELVLWRSEPVWSDPQRGLVLTTPGW